MAYHVSSKGSLTVCKAQPGKCPLGGKHFENEADGMEYLDNLNNKESLIEKFKNAPTPGTRISLRKEIRLLNQALCLEQDADIPAPQPSKEELERQKRIKEREIEEAKKEKEMAENLKLFEAKETLSIPKSIEKLRSNYLFKEHYFSRQDMYKSTYRGEMSKESRDHNTGTAMYGQGRYSTTNKKYASKYGEVRTVDYEEMPAKALSFKNVTSFEMFEQELAKEHNIDKRHMYRNQDLSVIIKKLGYDGITIGPKSDMIIVSYETKMKND
jgi:hypothetical protein